MRYQPHPIPFPPDLADRWAAYFADRGDAAARNRVLEAYLPLVRRLAERLRARLPPEVDAADLVQVGMIGLTEAIGDFDASRSEFHTYAPYRARGAMLDHLRAESWIPRLAISRRKKIAAAEEVVLSQQRHLTDAAVAARLGVSPETLARLRDACPKVTCKSFSAVVHDGDASRRDSLLLDEIPGPAAAPFEAAHEKDFWDWLTSDLDRAESLVVRLYYGRGLTMKEVGGALGLTESRVSQMNTSILARLKVKLGDAGYASAA